MSRPASASYISFVSTYLLISSLVYAQENPTQADLDALGRSISNVQSQIEETRQERNSLESELEKQEQEIAGLTDSMSALQSRIGEGQNRLVTLEAQSAELNIRRQNQQQLISSYLRAAYQNGQEEYLKLLLNQENISQSSRMLRYYQYFSLARADKIHEFELILEEIDAISSDIRETSQTLQTQRVALLEQQRLLEQEQNQRLSLITELDSTLASSNTELSRLEVQYDEMALLIEELSRVIVDLPIGSQAENITELRGALPWPLEGSLLNRFGAPYALGDLNWEGITIAGNSGADVHAVHHGRIIYADWFSNSGLLLIIDHGGGYMSLYAHNQSLYKEVGDWVLAGETIAAVGNTGGRNEYGVYFEIRYNGDAQDPMNWLIDR